MKARKSSQNRKRSKGNLFVLILTLVVITAALVMNFRGIQSMRHSAKAAQEAEKSAQESASETPEKEVGK